MDLAVRHLALAVTDVIILRVLLLLANCQLAHGLVNTTASTLALLLVLKEIGDTANNWGHVELTRI